MGTLRVFSNFAATSANSTLCSRAGLTLARFSDIVAVSGTVRIIVTIAAKRNSEFRPKSRTRRSYFAYERKTSSRSKVTILFVATGFSYEHKRNFEDSGNRSVILALRDKFSRVIDVLRCNDKSFHIRLTTPKQVHFLRRHYSHKVSLLQAPDEAKRTRIVKTITDRIARKPGYYPGPDIEARNRYETVRAAMHTDTMHTRSKKAHGVTAKDSRMKTVFRRR